MITPLTADERMFLRIVQETPRGQLEKRLEDLKLLESFKAAEDGTNGGTTSWK